MTYDEAARLVRLAHDITKNYHKMRNTFLQLVVHPAAAPAQVLEAAAALAKVHQSVREARELVRTKLEANHMYRHAAQLNALTQAGE